MEKEQTKNLESLLKSGVCNIKNNIKRLIPLEILSTIKEIRYGRTDYPYMKNLKIKDVSANFIIDNEIAKYRLEKYGDEYRQVKDFLSVIDENSVVLDVGASLGLNTVLASKKARNVISLEPDPDTMQALKKNLKYNESKFNVILIDKAAGNNSGVVTLFTSGENGNAPSVEKNVNKHLDKIIVEQIRIDDLISSLLKNSMIQKEPDIVKIDVEGYEKEVLEGMKSLLNGNSPPKHIFLELHPLFLSQFGTTIEETLSIIDMNKYLIISKEKRSNETLLHFKKN